MPFGGAVAAEVSCLLMAATTRQNTRYDKLHLARSQQLDMPLAPSPTCSHFNHLYYYFISLIIIYQVVYLFNQNEQ